MPAYKTKTVRISVKEDPMDEIEAREAEGWEVKLITWAPDDMDCYVVFELENEAEYPAAGFSPFPVPAATIEGLS